MEQVVTFIKNGDANLIGITGGAGAGKTTLSKGLNLFTYHVDDSFIGDSNFRKKLLEEKRQRSEEAYLDMTLQYNWWNWEKVEEQVKLMKKRKDKSILEGAILGPPIIIKLLDIIFFIDVPERTRLARLMSRDELKRDREQILERFFLTNKSEKIYYEYLFKYFPEKIYRIDEEYNFI